MTDHKSSQWPDELFVDAMDPVRIRVPLRFNIIDTRRFTDDQLELPLDNNAIWRNASSLAHDLVCTNDLLDAMTYGVKKPTRWERWQERWSRLWPALKFW